MYREKLKGILLVTLVSGAAALVPNLFLVFSAEHLMGASMTLMAPGDAVPRKMVPAQMIPESFVMSLAGALLFLLVRRFTERAYPVFSFLVAVITALWTLGPLSHGTDILTKIALSATHFVIAGAILATVWFFMARTGGEHPGAPSLK